MLKKNQKKITKNGGHFHNPDRFMHFVWIEVFSRAKKSAHFLLFTVRKKTRSHPSIRAAATCASSNSASTEASGTGVSRLTI